MTAIVIVLYVVNVLIVYGLKFERIKIVLTINVLKLGSVVDSVEVLS